MCLFVGDASRAEQNDLGASPYGEPKLLGDLASDKITESSGLASSRRTPGLFWTHNDSGDQPRLFAFNLAGEDLGSCRFANATAIDWEDIASFERDGKAWLLVADVGDNAKKRKTCQLYLVEEPAPGTRMIDAQKFEFQYEDGPHDCESIAVDPATGLVLLTVKTFGINCAVFQLQLEQAGEGPLIAHKVASVPVSFAVAMDIRLDSRRAIILTYGDAFEFSKSETETWEQAFARAPRRITMPPRSQGESICYGYDGQSLFLTSERRPSPLWQVPAEPAPDRRQSLNRNPN